MTSDAYNRAAASVQAANDGALARKAAGSQAPDVQEVLDRITVALQDQLDVIGELQQKLDALKPAPGQAQTPALDQKLLDLISFSRVTTYFPN